MAAMKAWLAVCLLCTIASWQLGHAKLERLDNGELVQHEMYQGSPLWKTIPLLWVPKTINVTCTSTRDFKVYTASSLSELSDKIDRNQNVWCGWPAFWGKHSCMARLSPFGPAHLGIQHPTIQRQPCSLEYHEKMDFALVIQTLLGIAGYLLAGYLSNKVYFRLGTGSAGFMALSAVILLLLISRSLPSKRSGLALFAVFGSSFTGLVRYVFGQWIPSIEQLVYNKIVVVYLVVSGLIGLAVTYYYDRDDNTKLHRIMKVGLKLVGLVLVYFGTTSQAASIALCIMLTLSDVFQPLYRLWQKGQSPVKDITAAVTEMCTSDTKPAQAPVTKPAARRISSRPASRAEESDVSEGEDIPAGLSSASASANAFDRATKIPLSDEDDGSPSTSFVPLGGAETDSPWLKKGLALNMDTGRTVKMHGATWNKLMAQGYELNRLQGTLTPPAQKKGPGTASKTRRRRQSVDT